LKACRQPDKNYTKKLALKQQKVVKKQQDYNCPRSISKFTGFPFLPAPRQVPGSQPPHRSLSVQNESYYSFLSLKMDMQKVAVTLMARGKTGFL
jgi:hypothetical protein